MKFTQIRNATSIITFFGVKFLIDPWLAKKETIAGFAGTLNAEQRNPTVDLPIAIQDIIHVDAVIVTHIHPDHWDNEAGKVIPKDMPIFVQDEQDKGSMVKSGFTNVSVLGEQSVFRGIELKKTNGQHGMGAVYSIPEFSKNLGDACGVIFRKAGEPTTYLVGDTIWTKEIAQNLLHYTPEIVIINAGSARLSDNSPIIMGKEDFISVNRYLPNAKMIATHLEAVNHAVQTRANLKVFIKEHDLDHLTFIPEDGETITINAL